MSILMEIVAACFWNGKFYYNFEKWQKCKTVSKLIFIIMFHRPIYCDYDIDRHPNDNLELKMLYCVKSPIKPISLSDN